MALQQSRYGDAAEISQQALPLYRQIGARLGEAGCLWSMARLARAQDQTDGAREASTLAEQIYSAIGLTAQAGQFRPEATYTSRR